MRAVFLLIVLLFTFVLTPAKPVKEDEGDISSRHGDKPDVDDELENSGETDDEDEEDGSTTEEPRTRQKRDVYMELEGQEKIKDSSGDDLEEEDEDDSETKEDKSSPKSDRSKNKNKSDSDTKELQMQNAMGIKGPFTITALQPPGSQNPSQKWVKQDPFSLDFASPPGNIEITPLEPAVNRMKKVRRRCMCPFPCGPAHSFEVIGCSGPYTVPCGGFGGGWPGQGCGGFGGMVPPYGWGGYGGYGVGHPVYGGGFGGFGGFGGCGGCGGYGGCGGCGSGGGCGYPPIMMCCK